MSRDTSKFDYLHILPQTDGSFTVKGYDTYPEHSVLAGQTRISFIDSFDTLEEAEAAYPDAKVSHPLLEPYNTFDHLEGEDL